MRKPAITILLVATFALAFLIGGCGGELSRSGWGKITRVDCNGGFSVAYPNGVVSPKKLSNDSSAGDYRTLLSNKLKPAKVVETPEGGTITFQDGETIRFKEVQRKE